MPPPRRLPRARCRLIFVMGLLEMMMLTNPFSALPRNYFSTTLADPPWRFTNKTGKVAPEYVRLHRYHTMTLEEIMTLPVEQLAAPTAHLYLWCPNALLPERSRGHEGVGIHLQIQPRVAQGAQGRRIGRTRRRLLLPQRDGAHPVRCAWQRRTHARVRAPAGKSVVNAQTRAFAQTR